MTAEQLNTVWHPNYWCLLLSEGKVSMRDRHLRRVLASLIPAPFVIVLVLVGLHLCTM